MKYLHRVALFVVLGCAAVACGVALTRTPPGRSSPESAPTWIANLDDNICGLSDLRLVSSPARVDYERLLRATPEIRRIEREQIDSKSSLGIVLRAAAVDRIRSACELVRVAMSHCSVWKAIRRADGRPVVDRTQEVLDVISKSVETAAEGDGRTSR